MRKAALKRKVLRLLTCSAVSFSFSMTQTASEEDEVCVKLLSEEEHNTGSACVGEAKVLVTALAKAGGGEMDAWYPVHQVKLMCTRQKSTSFLFNRNGFESESACFCKCDFNGMRYVLLNLFWNSQWILSRDRTADLGDFSAADTI